MMIYHLAYLIFALVELMQLLLGQTWSRWVLKVLTWGVSTIIMLQCRPLWANGLMIHRAMVYRRGLIILLMEILMYTDPFVLTPIDLQRDLPLPTKWIILHEPLTAMLPRPRFLIIKLKCAECCYILLHLIPIMKAITSTIFIIIWL